MDTLSIRETSPEVRGGVRQGRRCEVCGIPATERTLIGLKNDRRRGGPRFCVAHNPQSKFRPGLAVVLS